MGVETVTRCIAPLVSTDWLEAQLAAGELVIVDIRFAEEYAAGHIPGAVSAPFSPVSSCRATTICSSSSATAA
jgi:rhodanese-related sulfurtransferase